VNYIKIAQENVEVATSGRYLGPRGPVLIEAEVRQAIQGTIVHFPDTLSTQEIPVRCSRLFVEVTSETSSDAGFRLSHLGEEPCLLNFASGKHPGGGFLRGAKAQEEDLCRQSVLFSCLETVPQLYESHRATNSPLYSDALAVSPSVPFFRTSDYQTVDRPYFLSVVTCPAPNASALPPSACTQVVKVFRKRARHVLTAMALQSGVAVLGAWGCGVFGNDPEVVAGIFRDILSEPGFRQAFTHVTFAVPPAGSPNFVAFADVFCRQV